MGQINYVCEFGEVHKTGNCRCLSTHVETRQVKCDLPEQHKPLVNRPWSEIVDELAEEIEDRKMTLYERMEKTVDGFLGSIVMPVVRDSLVEQLENDVKNWLFDNSKNL